MSALLRPHVTTHGHQRTPILALVDVLEARGHRAVATSSRGRRTTKKVSFWRVAASGPRPIWPDPNPRRYFLAFPHTAVIGRLGRLGAARTTVSTIEPRGGIHIWKWRKRDNITPDINTGVYKGSPRS